MSIAKGEEFHGGYMREGGSSCRREPDRGKKGIDRAGKKRDRATLQTS